MDHLKAEVIYPGLFGLQFWTAPDVAYQRACWRVYNDWLSEFCAAAPERLIGAGFLPMKGPMEWAIEEAQRIARKPGLRSISIPAEVADRSYRHAEFDPLWEVLQDIGLPVSIHSGTSTGEPFATKFERLGMGLTHGGGVATPRLDHWWATHARLGRSHLGSRAADVGFDYPHTEGTFPQTQVCEVYQIVEGWASAGLPLVNMCLLGHVVRLMDHWWADHHRWLEPRLDEAPSTYFKRQFWATFEDDRAGAPDRFLGVGLLPCEGLLNGD